jgi:CRP-like cAMP-binding protein
VGEMLASAVCRLSEEQREAVAGYAAKVSWPAGFAIYQRGAPADGVFIVARGRGGVRCPVRAGPGIFKKK